MRVGEKVWGDATGPAQAAHPEEAADPATAATSGRSVQSGEIVIPALPGTDGSGPSPRAETPDASAAPTPTPAVIVSGEVQPAVIVSGEVHPAVIVAAEAHPAGGGAAAPGDVPPAVIVSPEAHGDDAEAIGGPYAADGPASVTIEAGYLRYAISEASFEAEPASDEEASPGPVPVSYAYQLSPLPAYEPAYHPLPLPLPVAPAPMPAPRGPFEWRVRLLCGLGGAVLLLVFMLPWSGARSWELLRYLTGADYARQIGFLIAGAVLLSAGLLPVPSLFRAGFGALVSTVPLLFGGVLLSPWQGRLALLGITLLPATLLLRTQLRHARLPRMLGLLAVLAMFALYLVPRERVAPLRVALDLIYYQHDEMARLTGGYLLLPLPLIALSTVALLGTDVAVIGELLSWLLLCWGPGALLFLAIDKTQAYMAAAVLCYSSCAAYCLADLLRHMVLRRARGVV